MPESVSQKLEALGQRYGLTTLTAGTEGDWLLQADQPLAELLQRQGQVGPRIGEWLSPTTFAIALGDRGLLNQALLTAGYPAADLAGYLTGDELPLELFTLLQLSDQSVFLEFRIHTYGYGAD